MWFAKQAFTKKLKILIVAERSVLQKEVKDYYLNIYPCNLIAQNGDSKKKEIAFAQDYFTVQKRKLELIEQRIQSMKD